MSSNIWNYNFVLKVDHSLGATPLEGGLVHGRHVAEEGGVGGGGGGGGEERGGGGESNHQSFSVGEDGRSSQQLGRRSPLETDQGKFLTEVDTDSQFCSITDC